MRLFLHRLVLALRISHGKYADIRVHEESNKRSRESFKCGRVLSMPLSSVELQKVPSLSRRRNGFDSRTGRHLRRLLRHRDAAGCGNDIDGLARFESPIEQSVR